MRDTQHPSERATHQQPTQGVAVRTYFVVYGALLILMFLTVFVAQFDLEGLDVVVALIIAVTKAALVLVYFMHLRHSSSLTWLFASAGFVWLLILLVLMMTDYLSRGWVEQ